MAAFQANEADVQEYLVITLPPVPTEEPTARAEAVVVSIPWHMVGKGNLTHAS